MDELDKLEKQFKEAVFTFWELQGKLWEILHSHNRNIEISGVSHTLCLTNEFVSNLCNVQHKLKTINEQLKDLQGTSWKKTVDKFYESARNEIVRELTEKIELFTQAEFKACCIVLDTQRETKLHQKALLGIHIFRERRINLVRERTLVLSKLTRATNFYPILG